jgi:hypothetical protein
MAQGSGRPESVFLDADVSSLWSFCCSARRFISYLTFCRFLAGLPTLSRQDTGSGIVSQSSTPRGGASVETGRTNDGLERGDQNNL